MTLIAQLSQAAHLAQVVLAAEEEETAATMGVGFAGSFWVLLPLAIVLFLLGFDLVRRLRRAKYRAEIQEELAGEIALRDEAGGLADSGETGSSSGSGGAPAGESDPRSEPDNRG